MNYTIHTESEWNALLAQRDAALRERDGARAQRDILGTNRPATLQALRKRDAALARCLELEALLAQRA